MLAVESFTEQNSPAIADDHILVLLGPIYFEGREEETIEFKGPWDLLKDPVIDNVAYRGLTRQRRQVLNLLTSIPEGMGIMRRSLARAVYPTLPLDLALKDLSSERGSLNAFLHPHYEIYNPVDSRGQIPEARYCLRRIDQWVPSDRLQIIDWEAMSTGVSRREPDAFTSLFGLTKDSIFKYLMYKTENPFLAEELMSQTYARAWENAERFRYGETPISHWLMKIASNVAMDYWRGQMIQKRRLGYITDEPDDLRSGDRPAEEVERNFQNAAINQAIAKLPDEQRAVLVFRFMDGYSHADVARLLGKSEANVRQIQSRALVRVRKILLTSGYLSE